MDCVRSRILFALSLSLAYASGWYATGWGQESASTWPRAESAPPPRSAEWLLPSDEPAPLSLPLAEVRQALQKLRAEREGLQEDRAKSAQYLVDTFAPGGDDIGQLRLRLGKLLTQMGTQKPGSAAPAAPQPPSQPPKKIDIAPAPPPAPIPKAPDKETPPAKEPTPDLSKTLDPLALAQALFRVGNYAGALQAYRLLPLDGLKAEERVPIQYMIATCLRKSGKTDEAAALYREVANSRGDEQVAACAQWQLTVLRWQKDMTEQLGRIRQRRLELEKQP
jgi:hypothetical protein